MNLILRTRLPIIACALLIAAAGEGLVVPETTASLQHQLQQDSQHIVQAVFSKADRVVDIPQPKLYEVEEEPLSVEELLRMDPEVELLQENIEDEDESESVKMKGILQDAEGVGPKQAIELELLQEPARLAVHPAEPVEQRKSSLVLKFLQAADKDVTWVLGVMFILGLLGVVIMGSFARHTPRDVIDNNSTSKTGTAPPPPRLSQVHGNRVEICPHLLRVCKERIVSR